MSNASILHQNRLTFSLLVFLNLEWGVIVTECAFENPSVHTVELKSRATSVSIISQKNRKSTKALLYTGISEGRRFPRDILSPSKFTKLFKFELNTINMMSISYTGIFSVDLLGYMAPLRPFCSRRSVTSTAAVYNHKPSSSYSFSVLVSICLWIFCCQ